MNENKTMFKIGDKVVNEYGRLLEISGIQIKSKGVTYIFEISPNYREDEFNEVTLEKAEEIVKRDFNSAYLDFIEKLEVIRKMQEKINHSGKIKNET